MICQNVDQVWANQTARGSFRLVSPRTMCSMPSTVSRASNLPSARSYCTGGSVTATGWVRASSSQVSKLLTHRTKIMLRPIFSRLATSRLCSVFAVSLVVVRSSPLT